MFRVIETSAFDLWLSRLEPPFEFTSPFGRQDFALLLLIADSDVTEEARGAFSRSIVCQGCRYAVCTGDQCVRWHDAIDIAYLETSPDFSPEADRFMMTTWHENESFEDVVHFLLNCTSFDDFTPQHFLVLILGGDAHLQRSTISALEMSVESQY